MVWLRCDCSVASCWPLPCSPLVVLSKPYPKLRRQDFLGVRAGAEVREVVYGSKVQEQTHCRYIGAKFLGKVVVPMFGGRESFGEQGGRRIRRQKRKGGDEDIQQPNVVHYVGGLDDIEGCGSIIAPVISAIKGERSCTPRRDGEIRRRFSSANVVEKSSTKKEGVTGEEPDDELPRFILNKGMEVFGPAGKL